MIQIPINNDGSFVLAGPGMTVAVAKGGYQSTPSWAQSIISHLAADEGFFYSEASAEEIKALLEQADEA